MPVKTPNRLVVLCVLSSALLVSCDWVDSAGTQGAAPRVTVLLDDSPVGSTIILQEKTDATIEASSNAVVRENGFSLSPTPSAQGALSVCEEVDGFDASLAAATLADACTVQSGCELNFNLKESTDYTAAFELTVPQLKASVGLRYTLNIDHASGDPDTRDYEFCLIAVNEAPDANDDTFVIREGFREIISLDQDHLLSNDTDDIDVSNSALSVLPDPVTAPRSAEFLELRPDGSFTYESSLSNIDADQFDTFQYAVTDGRFTSTATVTLRIVAANQSPELIDDIPVLMATEEETFRENLSLYFVDPEGGSLTFSLLDNEALPQEGTLRLRSNGVLAGVPGVGDAGTYALTLVTSDGGKEIETPFTLDVAAASVVEENSPPEYIDGTVFNQLVQRGVAMLPVEPEFVDADGDTLTYAMATGSELPRGVTIDDETGVVSGRPTNRGWVLNLRIEATDPSGQSAVSDPFYIRVQ